MTVNEMGLGDMMKEAEKLGEERSALEKRNAKRKAKGRPPLPDEQERADDEVRRIRHRTGKVITVDGANAMKLYEERKAAMLAGDDPDDEQDEVLKAPKPAPAPAAPESAIVAMEKAQREAAAARRVSDMKNGRIDHQGVWEGGQKLEGGDSTQLPQSPAAPAQENKANDTWEGGTPEKPGVSDKVAKGSRKPKGHGLTVDEFFQFQQDLYYRLKESFAGLEQSLSDLQGRVAELSLQSVPVAAQQQQAPGAEEFNELLEKRVPVVFDVGGAKMSFDAITVFHASPCITVVTKIGSATITPKPGAQLKLSYEMNGVKYENDPVTYLGTRFEIPMFGLAFIGFIRDLEASQLDVDAGREEGQPQ